MTTADNEAELRLQAMKANIARLEQLSQRLAVGLARKREADAALSGPSHEVYAKAATAFMTGLSQNPARMMEAQIAFWGRSLAHYVEARNALASGSFRAPADPTPKDRRFANPLWQTHPYFNWIKQQYLLTVEAVTQSVDALEHLEPADKKRIAYFSRQIVDMLAPTNFLATNPDALERAIATDGESLVRGLENLVRDVEAHGGDIAVTLSDPAAFEVGRNLATTPGSVVYRNRMLELIQYTPATATVFSRPLLIFPPWINKFYVLDLKPENSLIGWLVGQGFTVFVASWVNPDASYADTGLDDYIRDGYMQAMAEVRRICDVPQINAVGYCIAGTTLGLALAHLERAGDPRVGSATFLTTLTDFSDQGEVGVFLNEDFVGGIERQVAVDGVLDQSFMQRTFSYLRSNDLIYQPAIRSYMLGEPPPAFDLLYWNGDSTNLPAKMAMEYLRGLCQRDEFARGLFPVFGAPVRLDDIRLPVFAVACETDHIAAWKSSFAGIAQFGSQDRTFVLSQSGHIAGIVNPPTREKYGHYVSDAALDAPDRWKAGASFHKGSWWPRWRDWLAQRSGEQVAARTPGALLSHPTLAPSPGTYVTAIPAMHRPAV